MTNSTGFSTHFTRIAAIAIGLLLFGGLIVFFLRNSNGVVDTIVPTLPSETPTSANHSLVGTQWLLTDLDGDTPLAERELTLRFMDNTLEGDSGCNHFHGLAYMIEGDSFSTDGAAYSTDALCETTIVNYQELRYGRLLGQTTTITQPNSDTLILSGPEGTLTFELMTAPQ